MKKLLLLTASLLALTALTGCDEQEVKTTGRLKENERLIITTLKSYEEYYYTEDREEKGTYNLQTPYGYYSHELDVKVIFNFYSKISTLIVTLTGKDQKLVQATYSGSFSWAIYHYANV